MSSGHSSWSLEQELLSLSGASSLRQALLDLGLTQEAESSLELEELGGWHRGGAETYLYVFAVNGRRFLLKACVAYTPGGSIEAVVQSWIQRRRLLACHGVSTPKLYAYRRGCLLEEYIPYRVKDLSLGREDFWSIVSATLRLVEVLARCGFQPLGLFGDLRSHGSNVVLVDFGADLGPPGAGSRFYPGFVEDLRAFLGGLSRGSSGENITELLDERLSELSVRSS